jgi:phosphopantothenate---cysteine ligase (CTP)
MLKGKKILVTSGGTQEYIDDVRVMTNISSGKLGATIATRLHYSPAEPFFLRAKGSEDCGHSMPSLEIKSAEEAMKAMKKIIIKEKIDAVIHCMAVSDFTFKRSKAVKCKSSDPQAFIDYMRNTIQPNPKIISMIKQWRPKTLLVGFKFEVGITNKALIMRAEQSIEKNGCDLVVANDKEEMKREGKHIAYFVYSARMKKKFGVRNGYVESKQAIAEQIVTFLDKAL